MATDNMTLEEAVALVQMERERLLDERDAVAARAIGLVLSMLEARGKALVAIRTHVFADLPEETSPPRNRLQLIAALCDIAIRDTDAGEYFDKRQARTSKRPCRRCTDCEGQEHHWQDGIIGSEEKGDPVYQCKHCDATAPACAGCGGIVLPHCIDPDCSEANVECTNEVAS